MLNSNTGQMETSESIKSTFTLLQSGSSSAFIAPNESDVVFFMIIKRLRPELPKRLLMEGDRKLKDYFLKRPTSRFSAE